MPKQSRRWCFTGYPLTRLSLTCDSSPERVKSWCQTAESALKKSADITYFCFQPELTSVTPKRLHLQGVVYLKKKKALGGMVTLMECLSDVLNPPHLEPMKGTWDEAVGYCRHGAKRYEGEEFYEHGTPPAGGTRTDLDEVHKLIMDGACEWDLIRDASSFNVYAKYPRAIARAISLASSHRVRGLPYKIPNIHIYWGPTGSGKSREVERIASEADQDLVRVEFNNGGSSNWFPPDIKPQSWVLFDDFYGGISWHALLRICDGYGTSVQCKGGDSRVLPERVFFTSNKHPEKWYTDEAVPDKTPLWRRVRQGGGGIWYVGPEGFDSAVQIRVLSDYRLESTYRPSEVPLSL